MGELSLTEKLEGGYTIKSLKATYFTVMAGQPAASSQDTLTAYSILNKAGDISNQISDMLGFSDDDFFCRIL